jgi:hypothetical protein
LTFFNWDQIPSTHNELESCQYLRKETCCGH